jgi:hypothetical protein
MAINILTESVFSLAEAPKYLPVRRMGKQPNIATLYRWAQTGCKGVKLEFLQVGGTKCTSQEALQRFFTKLTAMASGEPLPKPAPSRARAAAVKRAERVLDAAGI